MSYAFKEFAARNQWSINQRGKVQHFNISQSGNRDGPKPQPITVKKHDANEPVCEIVLEECLRTWLVQLLENAIERKATKIRI